MFIQNIINFLIIAFSVFMFIKIVNKLFARFKEEPKKESKKEVKETKKVEPKQPIKIE